MKAKELKKWRTEELGLTQQELGELFGYKVWTISKWEQKGGIPKWVDVIRASVTISELKHIARRGL